MGQRLEATGYRGPSVARRPSCPAGRRLSLHGYKDCVKAHDIAQLSAISARIIHADDLNLSMCTEDNAAWLAAIYKP